MKPLNYVDRRKNLLEFALIFSVTISVLFITGFLMLKTAQLGVNVLEEKHAKYSETFRKKAALTYDIEEMIKKLYQINDKNRNLSQHKKFQDLVSDIRDKVAQNISEDENPEKFTVYQEMINVIKVIQNDWDTYKEENEKYMYLEELLERCKEKYMEELEKKSK